MTAELANLGASYTLAPDILLTPTGPKTDLTLQVEHGKIIAIVPTASASNAIRLPGRAITPGFTDTHTHLGQAFGKAFVFGEPSQIWQRIWGPLEGALTPDLQRISATWMFLEALRGGFTTICNFAMGNAERTQAIHEAAATVGIRLVSCTGSADIADFPLPPGAKPKLATIPQALQQAADHLALCASLPRITPSVCCSGIQGATPELMAALSGFCAEHDMLLQFHSNEHFPEVHGTVVKFGKRPIQLLGDYGALGHHVLLHHCTLVDDREITLLAETGTAVSYNPVASLWKGDGIAPALNFIARGVRFGLGTDSTRADGFRLLDAAEACQRAAYGQPKLDFSCGAGWTWVTAATSGAADAAGLGATTGRLEAGLAADFLVLDMNRPEVLPSWDFEWELVRLYNRDQIDAVFIDGHATLLAGRATGWDQDAFLREELPRAIATVKNSNAIRCHGPSTAHRPQS